MDISLKDAIELVHQATGATRADAARCIAGALARGAIIATYETLIETVLAEVPSALGVEAGPQIVAERRSMYLDFWLPMHCSVNRLRADRLVSEREYKVAELPSRWAFDHELALPMESCWLVAEAFGVTVSRDDIEAVLGKRDLLSDFMAWPHKSGRGRPPKPSDYFWQMAEALMIDLARGDRPFELMSDIEIAAAYAKVATKSDITPDFLSHFRKFVGRVRSGIEALPPASD